ALRRVDLRLHLGLYVDESAAVCDWHVPQAHVLEAWGDTRGHDGTILIQQPLIEPLYGGKSAVEFLNAIFEPGERRGREIVRDHHRTTRGSPNTFDDFWTECVRRGFIPDTAVREVRVDLKTDWANDSPSIAGGDDALELQFLPDPTVFDGRFANN